MRGRKPSSRSTSPLSALPTITGPPAPLRSRPHAAQDQRAHDPLAEFGLLDQQIAQPPRRNDQRLDRLFRHPVDQRRAARQLRQLAHERARPVGHDQLRTAISATVRYIDLAGEQDESSRRDLAGGKDLDARRICSEFPKPGNPANFRRLQYREHLVVSSFEK